MRRLQRDLSADDSAALRLAICCRLQRRAIKLQGIADKKRAALLVKPITTALKDFQKSVEWRALSIQMRQIYPKCKYCGAVEFLQTDHIKPKSLFPQLALDPENLQVLCRKCNFKKGARIV